MNGIKTGYTRASGYNLVSSVRRNGRHLVAAVMGERSGESRNRLTAALIEAELGGRGGLFASR
jgi:D-alanyl-D-alanine carboxypeptidase